MKNNALSGIVVSLLSIGIGTVGGQTRKETQAQPPKIVERGPHHRVLEQEVVHIDADGKITGSHIQRNVELATGMHYFDGKSWQETDPTFQMTADGAVVTKGAHKVTISGKINSVGAVRVEMPDGQLLSSHVVGLSFYEAKSGRNVLIAEPKDCVGELVSPNQIVFRDAFTDFQADIRYTYTQAGIEQDIILRSKIPSPEEYQLDAATTRLQVFTEFDAAPDPQTKQRDEETAEQLPDQEISFGAMGFAKGKAFSTGATDAEPIPVAKKWQRIQERTFLIEELPYQSIAPQLKELKQASVGGKTSKAARTASLERTLPKSVGGKNSIPILKRDLVVKNDGPESPGLVIDYALSGSATNFIFQSDTTYFVAGVVTLSGTSTIEGGTVVKFRPGVSARVDFTGPIVCATDLYLPAIFTADADDVYGDRDSFWAINTPSGFYADVAMNITSSSNQLKNLNIRYSRKAFDFNNTTGNTLRNIQISHSGIGITATADYPLRNALLWDVQTNFAGGAYTSRCENVTIHASALLASSTSTNSTICFTNSLLVAVTNTNGVSYSTNLTVTLTNDAGVFDVAGAGGHYLPTNSAYLNLGTTNIDTTLLADLQVRTTAAPLVYSNAPFSTNQTFGQRALRDTDAPDLGYHYAPLDYAFGGVAVSGCTLELTNRAAAGFFETADYDGY